jgi:hypothetical protein
MKHRPIERAHLARPASVNSLTDLVGSLKKNVTAQLVRQFRAEMPAALIRRALDEAEHVAVETGFPHLFLPELAAEQVRRIHAAISLDEPDLGLHRAA